MNVKEVSSLMGASVAGVSAELFDKEIKDFAIDSRAISGGELFFALSQEDYNRAGFNGTFADGHRFIAESFVRGGIAAVARADRVAADENLRRLTERLLLVEDAIAVKARGFWQQLRITNLKAAERARSAGLVSIVDLCMKMEHGRYNGGLHEAGMNTELVSARRVHRGY